MVGQINTEASGWSRGRTGDAKIFCPREGAANAGWDVERGCQRSRNYMAKD